MHHSLLRGRYGVGIGEASWMLWGGIGEASFSFCVLIVEMQHKISLNLSS